MFTAGYARGADCKTLYTPESRKALRIEVVTQVLESATTLDEKLHLKTGRGWT
jgi:hypothetical protein